MNQHWDPCEYKLDRVIKFLNNRYEQGKSYSTLNTYKSALVLIFQLADADKDFLKRFLRGIYNLNPSKPRYNETWDPAPVLSYLSDLFPLESLSRADLTVKLVTLLALITAHRIQTLSKISLRNIKKLEDRIEIRITDKVKTSRPGSFQPLLVIPYFTENPRLCLASVINFYIDVTADSRSEGMDCLILTHRKPIHPASTQRISKWIRQALSSAGVDTEKFTSYSTRHAATSAAFRAGVSIEEIRKTAGWTEKSKMFNKFYNKPLHSSTLFAESILNSVQK